MVHDLLILKNRFMVHGSWFMVHDLKKSLQGLRANKGCYLKMS